MTVSDLLQRLEAATWPDQELADDVLWECGWRQYEDGKPDNPALWWESPSGEDFRDGDQPNPLSSVDAALTLVPEGADYAIEASKTGFKGAYEYLGVVVMGRSVTKTFGPTPAHALTIAALRARQHKE